MVLNILGTELRPYVFFRGNGELMSHVFAGTASDHTPALQGNFLLMDHMQLVPLLNGLIVQLQLKGCVSTDLGGSVQISLWNRLVDRRRFEEHQNSLNRNRFESVAHFSRRGISIRFNRFQKFAFGRTLSRRGARAGFSEASV